jgi:hypothetical protein
VENFKNMENRCAEFTQSVLGKVLEAKRTPTSPAEEEAEEKLKVANSE